MELISCLIASASVLALTPACVCKKTGKTTEKHNDRYIFKWEAVPEFDIEEKLTICPMCGADSARENRYYPSDVKD